jgi:hypothetical protein
VKFTGPNTKTESQKKHERKNHDESKQLDLWVVALVFGTTVRQDWPTVAIRLVYALLFFVLQVWEPSNRIALDTLMRASRPKE